MLAVWCGYGWGGGPWFLIFHLFWAIVLIGGFVLLRRRGPRLRGGPTAEDVLAERYAKGEIDADEYQQRLGVLDRRGR